MGAVIDGVDAAILGVSDPAPHLSLYRDALGFDVVGSGAVPGDVARRLWGTAGDDVPATVLAAAGVAHGRIVLLTVAGAPPSPHPHTSDLGLAGIDLYARDIGAAYADLTAAGRPWVAAPATWTVLVDDRPIEVTEAICQGPEGTPVVLVQPASPRGAAAWDLEPDRPFSELTSVVCHVPDVDAERLFWGPDGLGLSVVYDTVIRSGDLERMAGLAAGTALRLAFLAGSRTARVEVLGLQEGSVGTDRRPRQRTGHALGHSGWLLGVGDLDGALRRVTGCGGEVTGPAGAGGGVVLGAGRAASARTPNGIPLTFLEAP